MLIFKTIIWWTRMLLVNGCVDHRHNEEVAELKNIIKFSILGDREWASRKWIENLDEYESKIKGLAQLKVVKDLFKENFIFSNWIFRFSLEIHLKAPGCLGHQEICCVIPVHNLICFCTWKSTWYLWWLVLIDIWKYMVLMVIGAYKYLEVHGTWCL